MGFATLLAVAFGAVSIAWAVSSLLFDVVSVDGSPAPTNPGAFKTELTVRPDWLFGGPGALSQQLTIESDAPDVLERPRLVLNGEYTATLRDLSFVGQPEWEEHLRNTALTMAFRPGKPLHVVLSHDVTNFTRFRAADGTSMSGSERIRSARLVSGQGHWAWTFAE